MGKLVKRLMLDDSYAIGRNESWLYHMSQKGLHFKKYGKVFVYFEKGEPKDIKYRIDIIYNEPSQEQLEVYHDCGWDFAAKNGIFHVFCADEKIDTIELHTDPIEQSHTMDKLNKKLKNNLIIGAIAMVLFLGMIFSIYVFNNEPFLYMVQGQVVQQILIVIVELYVFYSIIRNYIDISKLKRSLSQGRQINHKENFEKARIISGILAGIFVPLALLTIFIPIMEMSKVERYTLPATNVNLPIVRLADIEQNPSFMRKEYINGKGIDFSNKVNYKWSELAPIQYDIDEHGTVKGEMWDDKSGEYSPSINTMFYKLRFSNMAENLTQDLINRYVYSDNSEIKQISNSKLDSTYVAEDGIRKQIFAYIDNKVIHVTYYGNAEIEDLVPLVEEKLLSYME